MQSQRTNYLTWALLILIIITSCKQTNGASDTLSPATLPATEPTIFFPRLPPVEGERAVMEADLRGKLIFSDGCLRLEASNVFANYLLIWPPDFKPRKLNDVIEILDENGQIVGQVGDEILTGGGEVPDNHISQDVRSVCAGPYFEVGDWHGPIEE